MDLPEASAPANICSVQYQHPITGRSTTINVKLLTDDGTLSQIDVTAIAKLFIRLLNLDDTGANPLGVGRVTLQIGNKTYFIRIQEVTQGPFTRLLA